MQIGAGSRALIFACLNQKTWYKYIIFDKDNRLFRVGVHRTNWGTTSQKFKLGLENSISFQNQLKSKLKSKSKIQITAWVNCQVIPKLNPKSNAHHIKLKVKLGVSFRFDSHNSTGNSCQSQNSNLKSNQEAYLKVNF